MFAILGYLIVDWTLAQVRAFDNYIIPLVVISLNALLATMLSQVAGLRMSSETLQHWDAVSRIPRSWANISRDQL